MKHPSNQKCAGPKIIFLALHVLGANVYTYAYQLM